MRSVSLPAPMGHASFGTLCRYLGWIGRLTQHLIKAKHASSLLNTAKIPKRGVLVYFLVVVAKYLTKATQGVVKYRASFDS